MRGDSLRDLYAKLLALMGLGVLAGAGALVDYWPAGVQLVPVEPVTAVAVAGDAVAPLPPPSTPVAAAAHRADLAAITARPHAPAADRAPAVRLVSASHDAFVPAAPAQLLSPALVKLRPVAWTTPPTPSLAVIAAAHVSGTDVPLSDPARFSSRDAGHFVPAVAASSDLADSDGFITGAMKRTGTTIVKTGARTGASLIDAMRVIGGAVRKALPD